MTDDAADVGDSLSSVTLGSLGKRLFNDTSLSEPAGQSCASCHDEAHAFADPRHTSSSEGAVAGRFGPRNAPSIKYASFAPSLTSGGSETGYSGGLFLDGRAATLEAQAPGPMFNALEMNNANAAAVVAKVKSGRYASQFTKLFGATAFDDADAAFGHIVDAIAEYERNGMTKRFTSKYDAYLAGKVKLNKAEARGLAIFEDATKGNCASCHLDKPAANGSAPLFTDFGYDNLGIPKLASNPFYGMPPALNPDGANYIDHGLSGAIINPRQNGKFRAQTLRNIALTAPYGHNGYFPTLKSIVQFYNTRDVPSAAWEAPEVAFDLNVVDMGHLNLSAADVDDVVSFLGTLTDGYR